MGAVIRFPAQTYPQDLLWAAPGTPERTARKVETFEPTAPQRFCLTPDGSGLERSFWAGALLVAFLIGFICGEYAVIWSLVGRL